MTIPEALAVVLSAALRNPEHRMEHLRHFQRSVWNRPEDPDEDGDIWETLGDLAHDLDFYEPDPVVRTEDPSYYGDQRFEDEVRAGLRKLQERGVRIPPSEQYE